MVRLAVGGGKRRAKLPTLSTVVHDSDLHVWAFSEYRGCPASD